MGVWQRQLLETSTIKDESSTVFWMQSALYHIDIRIPSFLDQLSIVSALDDYSNDELLTLAEQQGFAGVTQVTVSQESLSKNAYSKEAASNDKPLEVCQWLREIDYQPTTNLSDIGEMNFTGDNTLIETGLDAPYLEIWQRLEHSQEPVTHQFTIGKNRHAQPAPAYLMRAGKFVAFARQRTANLPKAISLVEAIQTFKPDRQQLLDWLDFEISFGEMLDENHWQIKHSTLPFKKELILKL